MPPLRRDSHLQGLLILKRMMIINSTFSILSSQSPARLLFLNIKTKLVCFQHVAIFFKTGGLNYKVYSLALWVREKG